MIPGLELAACGALAVPEEVMAHVVHVESSRNPFAIGVVGGRLLRQPRDLPEAVATVRMLEAGGYNYSIGLAQVNRVNFERFGLDTPEKGFDVCNNLAAGASILAECLQRHEGRWGDAFSCYYSGNPRTGYEHGYVQKVFDAMAASRGGATSASVGGAAIPLAEGGEGSRERVDDASQGWSAVYSARISAHGAQRTEQIAAVSSSDACEAGIVDPADIASQANARFCGAADSRPRERDALQRMETTPVPTHASAATLVPSFDGSGQAPEARFVEAMKAALRTEAHTSRFDNTQQSSNSRAGEASRVRRTR